MFQSHLAGSALDGTDGVGADPQDWMLQAVSEAGGVAQTLVGRGIEELTGTPATPAPAPQSAQVPTTGSTMLPGQVSPNGLPTVNPNDIIPAPAPKGPNKMLLFGGLAAAGLVGYLWYTGKIGGRKRRRRR